MKEAKNYIGLLFRNHESRKRVNSILNIERGEKYQPRILYVEKLPFKMLRVEEDAISKYLFGLRIILSQMYFKSSRFRNILISPFFLKTEDKDSS